jgi:hypothetical protein
MSQNFADQSRWRDFGPRNGGSGNGFFAVGVKGLGHPLPFGKLENWVAQFSGFPKNTLLPFGNWTGKLVTSFQNLEIGRKLVFFAHEFPGGCGLGKLGKLNFRPIKFVVNIRPL